MKFFWLAVLSFMLMACGAPEESVTAGVRPGAPPQMWGDVEVIVETRPEIATVGMNEFLVMVTRKPRKPMFDMLVSIRMSESDPWRQSIQDGHVGVYRRSLQVTDPTTQAVLVRLERGDDKVELRFPLRAK